MKEIDVIRSVLVNFKLNQNKQLEAQKLQNLRKELQIGIDQMNEGKFSDLTLEDVLKQIHQKD
jgi:hypothetical protein